MPASNGITIRFGETDVRPMGRSAAGVRGMRMKPDDVGVSCDVARDDTAILIVTESGYGKRPQLARAPGHRGATCDKIDLYESRVTKAAAGA